MAKNMRLLLIGSVYIEMRLHMQRMPGPGETLIDEGGGSASYLPGGPGVHYAVAAGRAGVDVLLCARIGADTYGQQLTRYCTAAELDTRFLVADRTAPTGLWATMQEEGSAPRSVIFPGASQYITREQILDAYACLPDAVMLNFDLPFETILFALEQAKLRHIPVLLHPAPVEPSFKWDTLPQPDVLLLNDVEAEAYCGIRPQSYESCLRAALELGRRCNFGTLVLYLGDRGVFTYQGRQCRMEPAPLVIATDPAGGEASFIAAFAAEYLHTAGDIQAASRFGLAAASLTIQKDGTLSGYPDEDTIRARMNKH